MCIFLVGEEVEGRIRNWGAAGPERVDRQEGGKNEQGWFEGWEEGRDCDGWSGAGGTGGGKEGRRLIGSSVRFAHPPRTKPLGLAVQGSAEDVLPAPLSCFSRTSVDPPRIDSAAGWIGHV